jgi:thiol-disulfide isomerase/thioredoxin
MKRALVLAFAATLAACSEQAPGMVGGKAPDYHAVTLLGDSVSLADRLGHPVMLNIWATWCDPCREELPVLERIHEEYGPRGLQLVGVSIDATGSTESIRSFADQFGITYELWHDPNDHATSAFFSPGVPMTVLIDGEGIVRWRHVGPVEESDPALLAALSDALGNSESTGA